MGGMKQSISIFLCFLFSYLVFAFIEADFNPMSWFFISRALMLALAIGLAWLDQRK
jgi:hypothetical protein